MEPGDAVHLRGRTASPGRGIDRTKWYDDRRTPTSRSTFLRHSSSVGHSILEYFQMYVGEAHNRGCGGLATGGR